MTYKIYNIHDILIVAISNDVSFTSEIDAHLGFFSVLDNVNNVSNADIIINPFSVFDINEHNKDFVFDDYFFSNNFLVRKSIGLGINILDEKHLYYFSKLFLPINLIIQFGLLKKGFSFIHCAAFIINGKSFLLPAFGGVGKTSIMSFFAAKGAKIFGDDLCIVGKGQMYAYPQDMSIYDYHCKIFSNLPVSVHKYFFKRKVLLSILSPIMFFGPTVRKAVNFFLAKYYGECLNVKLNSVFGNNCISESSSIDFIIQLNKKSNLSPIIMNLEPVNISDLSKFCTSVVINEWNHYFNHLLLIDSCSGPNSAFSIDLFFKQTNEVILKSFTNIVSYKVEIDSKNSPEKVNIDFSNILSRLSSTD
jgi:hypothetical protein